MIVHKLWKIAAHMLTTMKNAKGRDNETGLRRGDKENNVLLSVKGAAGIEIAISAN